MLMCFLIFSETPQTHQEWLMLLQQQENLHRSEVHGWHEILVSAIKILHQVYLLPRIIDQ